jgi:subtilisin family serine protease
MCDYLPEELILSHHVTDIAAGEVVEDIRQDKIKDVYHRQSIKDILKQLKQREDLPWEIHRLQIQAGEEFAAINRLHKAYTERQTHARRRPAVPAPIGPNVVNDFMVVPNARLSFAAQSPGVDFTFSGTHTTYKKMLQIAGFTANTGATGAGVTVAIIDSGIEQASRLAVSKRCNVLDTGAPQTVDDHLGHGTTIASIVADVAPGAKLWIYKVADAGHSLNEFDCLVGLAGARTANVVNLSLCFGLPDRHCNICGRQTQYARSTVFANTLAYVLTDPKTVVVAAAGNEGMQELRYPARLPESIAVGSIDSARQLSGFSNYGTTAHGGTKHPHFYLLPGGQAAKGATTATETVGVTKTPHVPRWGTSFSAAYATGAIALMLSSKSPTPSRATLLSHLQRHADSAGYNGQAHGNGLLQVTAIP